jgi:outer membrane receptor protein involved in Fe transport
MKRIVLINLLLCITANFIFAQSQCILKGKVTGQNHEPIVGANIIIDGQTKGAISDVNGDYLITDLTEGEIHLKASFIGYSTQQVTVQLYRGDNLKNFMLQENAMLLEGLVVTAQKREERNMDVPIAITSVGNSFIDNINTTQYDGLSDYVPGLQVQLQSPNNPGIVIRGITSDDGDSRVEPRVSVFQDGVSISKSRGSVVELFDIERVEVLKGPQGTLFGRSAQIGAMHIIQNKAKSETSGSFKLGYGNYNQNLVSGYFNTPILKDKLFVRVAGIYNAYDGYIENLSGGTLNGKETLAFRTSLRYMLAEKTRLDVIANWQQDTPPGTSFKSGTYAPVGGDTDPTSFADLDMGEDLGLDRTVWGVTGILKHNFNETWDLTSTTAYRTFDSDEAFDADGSAAPVLFFHEISKGEQFSQEFRFNFDNEDRFKGFLGTNFFYEDGSQSVPLVTNEGSYLVLLLDNLYGTNNLLVDGIPVIYENYPYLGEDYAQLTGLPFNPANTEAYTNYGENYAADIFADFTYDFTDKFGVTLGLRATYEDITAGYKVDDAETTSYLGMLLGTFPNNLYASTGGEKLTRNESFLSAVGRLAANYKVTNHITTFANVAKGRRPNVINMDAVSSEVLSDEIVWSYELGMKSLFLNNRLQFDLNGYYYDYNHFQTDYVELSDNGGIEMYTDDAGSASALGFELGFQFAFMKSSSLFANYAFIDATFDDEDSNGNKQEYAGNTFRLTPKNSFSLGLNFNPAVSKQVSVYLRPSYAYKSKVYFDEDNDENIAQDAYGLLTFKAGVLYKKSLELGFYMNNALDEKYIIDAGNTGDAFGIPTYIAGPPRFTGAQISYKF